MQIIGIYQHVFCFGVFPQCTEHQFLLQKHHRTADDMNWKSTCNACGLVEYYACDILFIFIYCMFILIYLFSYLSGLKCCILIISSQKISTIMFSTNEFCMEYRSIYIINSSPPCVEYVVLLIKHYAINYVRKLLRYTKF